MIESPLGVYKIFGCMTTELLACLGIVVVLVFIITGAIQLFLKLME